VRLAAFTESRIRTYIFFPTDDQAILFMRAGWDDDTFITRFSVSGSSSSELRGRAVVTHRGLTPQNGLWKCSKDQGTQQCAHIKIAIEAFQEKYQVDDSSSANEDIVTADMVQGDDLGALRSTSVSTKC
jgi:hypothetical protein